MILYEIVAVTTNSFFLLFQRVKVSFPQIKIKAVEKRGFGEENLIFSSFPTPRYLHEQYNAD